MKWISNTHADIHIILKQGCTVEESMEDGFKYCRWIRGKVIGPPRPSEYYSLSELIFMNIVGVYEREGND